METCQLEHLLCPCFCTYAQSRISFRGPQWIYLSGSNPILDIATKTATPLHSWNEKINLYDKSGNLVDDAKAISISDLRWSIIEEAFEYSIRNKARISTTENLYDFFMGKAKEALPDRADRELLLGMAEMWGDYIGDPIQRQSLRFVWMEKCCGGGRAFNYCLKALKD
jgi:hypothetical protein